MAIITQGSLYGDRYSRHQARDRAASSGSGVGPGSLDTLWLDTTYLSLTNGGTPWTMPSPLWAPIDGFLSTYAVVVIDSLATAVGGSVDIAFESAPAFSTSDAAWPSIATANATGATTKLIKAGMTSSNPLGGLARLKLAANTHDVTMSFRVFLIRKHAVRSATIKWIDGMYVSVASGTPLILPADMWLPVQQFTSAVALVEFAPSSANLQVKFQTAALFNIETSGGWLDVGSSVTMGTSPAIYDMRLGVSNAPLALLRPVFTSNSGTVSGRARVNVLLQAIG